MDVWARARVCVCVVIRILTLTQPQAERASWGLEVDRHTTKVTPQQRQDKHCAGFAWWGCECSGEMPLRVNQAIYADFYTIDP